VDEKISMVKDRRKDLREKDFVDPAETEQGLRRRKRSRKTIGEEGSRKQTAIGLLATLALGLIFYLPTELKQWWKDFNNPQVITIKKPVGDAEDISEILGFKVIIKEKTDVEEVVKKMINGLSGDYGVFVEKLTKGESQSDDEMGFGINEGKIFSAASVVKLPILIVYYQAVDEGRLDPEDIYVLKEKDRFEYGTGSMQNQPEGTEYTYREVAGLMANQSDNMAAQIMIGWLGGQTKIDRIIRSWGFKNISVKENEVTSKEMGELLKQLYEGKLISTKSREELFGNLIDTVNEDRITAGVPTGVEVMHKFGSEEEIVNDCGIVYGDDPYVICLLSTEVNDGQAQEILPKISRVVWEWAGD